MFEISLVPDIKKEAIKAQKLRNLILFVCIIISTIALGVIMVLFAIKGGQDVSLTVQENKMKEMSNKLASFDNLNEFLTIQDELGNLATIAEEEQSVSRVFKLLKAVLPTGPDTVTLSEMMLSLEGNTLTIEGQANAGEEPYIDYRVLESFKKSIAMTHYDYGDYVDEKNNKIPAMCLTEVGEDGSALMENGSSYAIWYKGVKTCNPEKPDEGTLKIANRDTNKDEKIYRTPQFDKWYKEKKMTLDGQISNVAHFESKCKTYSGTSVGNSVRWDTVDEVCLVAPDGLLVSESSNGRDENDELMLRFTGTILIGEDVFKSRNNFLTIIRPNGQNVTDSYEQIENMFANRAKDCASNDADCQVNPESNNKEGND